MTDDWLAVSESSLSARPFIERRMAPGVASRYIHRFGDIVKPGDKVVLLCRASSPKQGASVADQERDLRQTVQQHGATVVDAQLYNGPGYLTDPHFTYCEWADQIVEASAIAYANDAILLATETDRLVRHPHSWRNKLLGARECDLISLSGLACGMPLATVLAPDAPLSQARSKQIKRGQKSSGNKGGRKAKAKPGDKKRRREQLLTVVLDLHAAGVPLREIVRQTGVPRRTVSRWIADGKQ